VGGESPHRRQLGPVGGGADDGAALGVGVVGGGVGLVLGAGGEVPPPQLRGLVLAAVLAALVLAADLAARAPAPARAAQSSLTQDVGSGELSLECLVIGSHQKQSHVEVIIEFS